ncbi:MAG: serine/threonine protein kinase [Myxococcales bacterium]|nr:serine/threonine protein kinase [Myxococcales bacterium]
MSAEDEPATVTDSPSANRRERRRSSLAAQGPEAQELVSQSSAPFPVAGSNQSSKGFGVSQTTSAQPSVHLDEATRLHVSRQALFGEDVGLLRNFSSAIGLLCLGLVVTLPFIGGDPMLKTVLWGGCLFSIFTSLWITIVLRDLERYDQRLLSVMTLLSVFVAYSGVLFLGVHSPAALFVLPGIYLVASSQAVFAAWTLYLVCAGLQGLLAILILAGTIRDPGLITAGASELYVRIIAQILIQLMYLGMFMLARRSRVGTLQAMNKVFAAENKAQEREAAFIEVREDLDRMLGAGGVGHYSERMLGRYKVGGIIGRGAMGEVYEAIHVDTAQLAAVKLLHPHVLAKPSSVERFLREAQAASALQSPHTVRVLDISGAEEAVPYLMMEKLTGYDLAQHLREVRRLSMPEIVALVEQVGSVIDLAASKGIVHRDLKPQNLFLAETPQGSAWKVLDFGASKLAEHSGTLTQGRVIGTPAYMSPQQAKGKDVDGAADRYCLAAIVYRALAGRPPFTGKDLPTTLYNVVYGTPPQPSVLADIDPTLDLVLAVGMAKNPKHRFPDAQAFANALRDASNSRISDSLKRHAEILLKENPWGMLPNQDD